MAKVTKRHFLVKYTNICGEYEFSGHTILTLKPKQNIRHKIHEYFMYFYGMKASHENGTYYYNGGEVGVKRIYCHKITEAQKLAIEQFNL